MRLSPAAAVAELFVARCSVGTAGLVQVVVVDAAPLRGRGKFYITARLPRGKSTVTLHRRRTQSRNALR